MTRKSQRMNRWARGHMCKIRHATQWDAWAVIDMMAGENGVADLVALSVYPCWYADYRECGKVAPLHWHVGHLIGSTRM